MVAIRRDATISTEADGLALRPAVEAAAPFRQANALFSRLRAAPLRRAAAPARGGLTSPGPGR